MMISRPPTQLHIWEIKSPIATGQRSSADIDLIGLIVVLVRAAHRARLQLTALASFEARKQTYCRRPPYLPTASGAASKF